MITRRRVLLTVAALFLVGVGVIAWTAAGLPPVKYYVRYGIDPFCGPTGDRITLGGIEFVEIGPGIYRTVSADGSDWLGILCRPLGLPWGRQTASSKDDAVRWLELPTGFWIATTEVTNAQYERFRADHERSVHSNGDDTPVVEVSWTDAKAWCAWLEEQTGRPLRLPSEAEWECACRAGSDQEYTFGDNPGAIEPHAWTNQNARGRAQPVATKKPNRWGLFDFHGNVLEWCEDPWSPSPGGSEGGEEASAPRVYRGGCWYLSARASGSSVRDFHHPGFQIWFLGFRPAFSAAEAE